MRFISIVCLVSAAFLAVFAQQDNCHLCELIVNDVFALHPNGLTGVPDSLLLAELGRECDKYLANQPDQDLGCYRFLTENGSSFIAAMRMYNTSFAVCKAPPASVCQ